MLTGPDHLVVLYVLCDGTQDDLLHNLPRQRECPTFLDSFALQDCLPKDSDNQAPKQAKVCPLEAQGGSSADPRPYFSENQKLYHFMIAMPKTASNHHITHKSFSVHKQQVQQGAFPSTAAIPENSVTSTAVTPAPTVTDESVQPGNQPVSASVAPIHKKKSWKQNSAHLEREDEGAGPSQGEEEEEEELLNEMETTQSLYLSEL
ncbi:hypothetical protein QYF61_014459 [Mycteria americana]|uniref:Uncharacterized protein n=1 Tax=Mycteria americana TaxID=33587 RepID=A0AAN7MQD4_MYCAM|nr:hypothetical protein QYF61_014459 [Mycteria americana]